MIFFYQVGQVGVFAKTYLCKYSGDVGGEVLDAIIYIEIFLLILFILGLTRKSPCCKEVPGDNIIRFDIFTCMYQILAI